MLLCCLCHAGKFATAHAWWSYSCDMMMKRSSKKCSWIEAGQNRIKKGQRNIPRACSRLVVIFTSHETGRPGDCVRERHRRTLHKPLYKLLCTLPAVKVLMESTKVVPKLNMKATTTGSFMICGVLYGSYGWSSSNEVRPKHKTRYYKTFQGP